MSIARKVMAGSGRITLVDSVVEATQTGGPDITTMPVGFEAGDLGVWLFSSAGTDVITPVPAMTTIKVQASSGLQLAAYAFIMDGTETGITTTGPTITASASVFAVFRGASLPSASDVTSITGGSGMPDPPAANAGSARDWILACGGLNNTNMIATAQAGYSLIGALGETRLFEDSSVMMSSKTGTAAADNPGVFGGAGSSNWIGFSLRISP